MTYRAKIDYPAPGAKMKVHGNFYVREYTLIVPVIYRESHDRINENQAINITSLV